MKLLIFGRWLFAFTALALLAAAGCAQSPSSAAEVGEVPKSTYPLPILGLPTVNEAGDSLAYQSPTFAFVNQDSSLITSEDVKGKVIVADFFFTLCPSICPKMSQQMVRIHDEFLKDDRLILLSHTIDPYNDSVAVLKEYADALDVSSKRWHMMTGERDSLYTTARAYMVSAMEDSQAPGGFLHSGAFVLVDQNRHIRGYYDGTKAEEVDQLMTDIRWLFDQNENGNP